MSGRPRSLPNRIDEGGRYKTCPGAPVEKERTEIAFCGFAHNKEGPSSWRRLDALPLLLTSCPGMHFRLGLLKAVSCCLCARCLCCLSAFPDHVIMAGRAVV